MQIRVSDLFGSTFEMAQAFIDSAQLPKKLPWGSEVTIISNEDASEPDQGRFGDLLTIEVEGKRWQYLGGRTDEEGFTVSWNIYVDTKTGEVTASAHPTEFATPERPLAIGSGTAMPFGKLGKLERSLGNVGGELRSLFSREERSKFGAIGLTGKWATVASVMKIRADLRRMLATTHSQGKK